MDPNAVITMNWASVCSAGPAPRTLSQVVELRVQLPKALFAGPDSLNPVSVLSQNRKKEFTNVLFVLDNQDSRRDVAFRLVIPHRCLRAFAID